ncbi:MAG: hypothetical protein J6D54_01605 [Olsenella sp.]|nr:hypothetical protein [Olsenella sp.]
MATSSIGRPVVLDGKRARRLMEILSRPQRPPRSESGRRLVLSKGGFDPKKIK